jgi:methionyl aminopeptidase
MIPIKTAQEISTMREGGKILAEIMEKIKKQVVPGKETQELDRLAESLLFKYGQPSFKNHQGFPNSLCVSLNEEVVHGVPSSRKIKESDLVSLDIGLFYQGFHLDMARTMIVGQADPVIQEMVETAEQAFWEALKWVKVNYTFGDLGWLISDYVEKKGFTVIRNLCGHGIGRELHEEPQIPNFGERNSGLKIEQGMVFCLEPIIGAGGWEIEEKDYSYVTKDRSLSAHYENTVALTSNGPQVLTGIE